MASTPLEVPLICMAAIVIVFTLVGLQHRQ